jgi:hypothetical protein
MCGSLICHQAFPLFDHQGLVGIKMSTPYLDGIDNSWACTAAFIDDTLRPKLYLNFCPHHTNLPAHKVVNNLFFHALIFNALAVKTLPMPFLDGRSIWRMSGQN